MKVCTFAGEDWSANEDQDSQSEGHHGLGGPYKGLRRELEPDQTRFRRSVLHCSQLSSVNERENLKSLSIMKHLSKAHVVLKI